MKTREERRIVQRAYRKRKESERQMKLMWALNFVLSHIDGEYLDPAKVAGQVNELAQAGTISRNWVTRKLREK